MPLRNILPWIFAGVILLAAFGVLEVPIALTLGAGLMVLAIFQLSGIGREED